MPFLTPFLVGRVSPTKMINPENKRVPTYSNLSNLEDLETLGKQLVFEKNHGWLKNGKGINP